jgi:hypothetical protein
VLETDGSFSVLQRAGEGEGSTLANVAGLKASPMSRSAQGALSQFHL